MNAADIVQVQLVNDGWGQALPILALLVSLFSVVLTLTFRYRDRLRLAVSLTWAYPTGRNGLIDGAARIRVEVTNRSRTATTQISQLTLQLPKGSNFAYTEKGIGDGDLPCTLGPGESVSISYAAQGLGITLRNRAKNTPWIRGRAVSGHHTAYGKKHRKRVAELRAYALEHPYEGG